jgi:branched-chain amino acid transport system substrate-binding protein
MWTGTRALRLGAAVFCMAGVLVGVSGGAASAAKAPIVIGMITDETGGAASSYVNAQDGAIARIDAQNAAGGVDGHKLVLDVVDSQSTPAGFEEAAQTLVQDKGAFGIIAISSSTFGGASYLQKKGVPVIGFAEDGPEWGQQPNTNMFSVSGILTGPINGRIYSYGGGQTFKSLHVTKLATVVANVPTAIQAADSLFAAVKPLGITKCLDDIVPLSAVNFTTFALQMKQLGCNGIEVLQGVAACIGVQTALKQAGLNHVADICATGYDQAILDQPSALAAMQGTYSSALINVLGNDLSAPVKVFLSNLSKYTSWPKGIPSEELLYSYESADLMIKGLQLAGPNPTQKTVISKLRNLNGWTSEGLIAAPGDDFQHFGTLAGVPKTQCLPLLELKGKSYVPALGGKPICSKLVSTPANG